MGMKWYVIRRLAWTLFVSWLALSVTWGLLAASPNQGEMEAAMQAAEAGEDAEEAQERYRERRGLDRPLHEQYIDYVLGVYTLDWGWSNERSQYVTDAILDSYPYSIQYQIPAAIITVFVAYSLGLYSAMNQYTPSDYLATFTAYFGLSIPNFWFAIMGILVLGVWLQDAEILGVSLSFLRLPTYYDTGIVKSQGWLSWGNAKQLLLPIVVISTAGFASQMRYSRAQALEYANSEFVKTARAKGASDSRVLIWHILRVAMVPLSTVLVGVVLGTFFGGALIIEYIFQIPGLGLLTFNAFVQQDTPIIMATFLIGVFLTLIGYLIQDLAYVWLDPRISYGDR